MKVVLGAAMWNNPHILVLDEPTNYLDRDSLGALAEAIKAFGGGVVMITHNREFYQALTQETWMVADGKLTPTGGNPAAAKEAVSFKVGARLFIRRVFRLHGHGCRFACVAAVRRPRPCLCQVLGCAVLPVSVACVC